MSYVSLGRAGARVCVCELVFAFMAEEVKRTAMNLRRRRRRRRQICCSLASCASCRWVTLLREAHFTNTWAFFAGSQFTYTQTHTYFVSVACGSVLPNFVPNSIPLDPFFFSLVHCFTATPSFCILFLCFARRARSLFVVSFTVVVFRLFHAKWIFKWCVVASLLPMNSIEALGFQAF